MHQQTKKVAVFGRVTSCVAIVAMLLALFGAPASAGISNTRVDPAGTLELSGSSWLGGSGVNVYSNGASSGNDAGRNTVNGIYSGQKWQCVELVNRLYITRGWTNSTWWGNGNQLYANAPANLAKQPNGSITYLNPGDVVAMDDGGYGHAGIVNSVSGSTVQIVNQNTTAVYSSATYSGNRLTMSGWQGYTIQGVIHRPASGPSGGSAPSGNGTQLLGDVDGDGKADAVVYFASAGDWYVAPSSSVSGGKWIAGHGAGSSKQFLADVNGDRKADAVAYFPSNGQWYVALSTGTSFGGYYLWLNGHGVGSTNQLLADVDGDGKADAVAYFGGSGAWYVAASLSPSGQWINGHGAGSSNQFLADVTGDGKADAVAYFGGSGAWYVAPSLGTGFGGYYLWLNGHGAGSSNQLLANVDSDAKADAIAYFASSGAWYVAASASPSGQWTNGHGAGSSNQLLADVTGDGKADAVAFFGQQGNWNVAPSTGTSFGGAYLWLSGHGAGSA